MRSFRQNQKGIVAVMAVMIATFLVLVMAWAITMAPVQVVWNTINPMLPSSFHGTMDMINVGCGVTALVLGIGILVWGAVHTMRKEVVDVPEY